jgi:NRPS condensation-like uncharacterized protein
MDEMFLHLDEPTRPLVVHVEVRVAGAIDETRLRDAIRDAVDRHPLARARLRPWPSDAKHYEWVVEDELHVDPLRVVDADTDPAGTTLDDVRGDFFSRAIPLVESPPFRVLLVHDLVGDSVLLAANHTGCDGIGALRLLQSVGRAYAGVPDPTTDVDPAEAHRLAVPPSEGRGFGDRVDSAKLGLRQVAQTRSRLAKVATKDGTPGPGYHVHTMSVPVAPVVASPLRRRVHATVNDVLLAAVHRSIDRWNRELDQRVGRVAIGMPVNARPEAWRHELVANLITSEMVTTLAHQRQSPEACLAAVTGWTEAVKRRGSGAMLEAQTRGWGGRVTQRRAFSPVVRLLAGLMSGTAAVSNLGSIAPDWVSSDQFPVRELWFSPPAFGADLGVGAVSMGDTLRITLRSVPGLFSDPAASEFAALLGTELDALCEA